VGTLVEDADGSGRFTSVVLHPAEATMLMLINVVNRKDDGFRIFLTLSRP
jgi:hypothetical protein